MKLTKKTNLIITSCILVVAIVVGIITGIEFYDFSNYDTYFYTGNVDEIQKYSQYSPLLKGTVGDSNIYVMHGSENTVALIKAEDAQTYASVESLNNHDGAIVVAVSDSDQMTAASATVTKPVNGLADATQVINAVKSGSATVGILRYEDAKKAVEEDETLAIAQAEVEKVPSLLILGGTHANEPSGQITATLFLENADVQRGTLYITTETNRSAYTHSQPQEASPFYYELETASGSTRTFKFGSRATNTNQQWPNPDIYTHSPSGQQLSSSEVRNINRAYPGSVDGNYTERVAYAITQCVLQNDISMVIDLHEASPEYITINAIVYHQDAGYLAASAQLAMELYVETAADGTFINGVEIKTDASPTELHGLTHRELGDFTNAYVFLAESSNASQGKLRGKFTSDLIITGEDKFYEWADQLGLLYAAPVHINERVARHTITVTSIVNAFNNSGTTRLGENVGQLVINNVPSYVEIYDNGVGYYLHDVE